MSSSPETPEYSIAAVSKLTGVSCHALRVWERRYGFPIPHRSASGHRRYSRDQVRVLRHVAVLAQGGQSIGDLIVGDADGLLCIPFDDAEEILAATRKKMDAEKQTLGDIAAGKLDTSWIDAKLRSVGCNPDPQ